MSDAAIVHDHVRRAAETGPWPAALDAVLSPALLAEAAAEIVAWPGYAPTPLRGLDILARELGVASIRYKDESGRFGLGSFKALGGAYAVRRLAADHVAGGGAPGDLVVVTATDGNHGRSVAWGAKMAGCRCRIYVHEGVSRGRRAAIEALGADIVGVRGDYDESVRRCADEAAANSWVVVSDTSYPGYVDVPRRVMAGYGVMAAEALDQMAPEAPTHVFVQAGVGGVAAAVCATMWQRLGERRPRFVTVEPMRAACVLASARAGRPAAVAIEEETIMAGLSCGEVSILAWDILTRGVAHCLAIGEEEVAPMMRRLAAGEAGGGPIVAGESAVPGLIGLLGAAADETLRRDIGLDADSRVLVFGCEGATDPAIYRAIINGADAGAAMARAARG